MQALQKITLPASRARTPEEAFPPRGPRKRKILLLRFLNLEEDDTNSESNNLYRRPMSQMLCWVLKYRYELISPLPSNKQKASE